MIRSRLQSVYARLKDRYLASIGYEVPERYRSSFVHWGGGAEAQYIYRRLLGGAPTGGRVLIVGVMGGRDYYLLKNLGYEVTALDVGPQPDVPDVVIGNIEEPLPFADGSFDAVVIGEVLEHLERDVDALRNIHRVLRDDGRLIVTVPFFNDWIPGHMRIHSPVSATRLLALGGFQVDEYVERPALFRPNLFNPIQHGVNLVADAVIGRPIYGLTNRLIGVTSWRLGRMRAFGRLRRLGKGYGAYFRCTKGPVLDHVAVNRDLYTEAPG